MMRLKIETTPGKLSLPLSRPKETHVLTAKMSFALSMLLLGSVSSSFQAQSASPRIALVIGNSTYSAAPSLPTPANDAARVAKSLRQIKFDVIEYENADQKTMGEAIKQLRARLEGAGAGAIGFFYYAGHAIQLAGRNYLVPVDANIKDEGDLERMTVSVEWVLERLRFSRYGPNIVILDACHNSRFLNVNAARGLAPVDAPAGMLVALPTAPGSVVVEAAGANSLYASALADVILQIQAPVEIAFKRVRVAVMDATHGTQVPWESSSLIGDFYFNDPVQTGPKPH